MELIKARRKDSPLIQQLQVAAFQALYDTYQDTGNPVTMTVEGVEKRMEQPGSSYYLLEEEECICGFIRVVLLDNQLRIAPIALLPEWQGKGLGKRAMHAIEQEFANVDAFVLDTVLQEEQLCHFYESLGYEKTGELFTIQPGMDLVDYRKENRK